MGVRHPIVRASVRACIGVGITTFLVVLTWALLWPERAYDKAARADVIVCLGGGMSADGTLHPVTLKRVETCVALYDANRAPHIHFTGGRHSGGNGPAAGARMAARAAEIGVPAQAITHEDRSLSTLQNALFSKPFYASDARLILVTEAFHLPRSWASFRWVSAQTGSRHSISLFMSERVRSASRHSDLTRAKMLLRETAALWFNAARALVWTIARDLNVAKETRDDWLA